MKVGQSQVRLRAHRHPIEVKLARFEKHFADLGHLLGAVEYRRSERTIAAVKEHLYFLAGRHNKLIEFRKQVVKEYIRGIFSQSRKATGG